jgi:TRAP-type mannitol/chloroaromatic compound transport system permease large subunit
VLEPQNLHRSYDPKLACGTICAAGTLGQILPPSTVLIFMADILQGANSAAQLELGNFAPDTVSVGDLFAGAMIPSLILAGLYALYIIWRAIVAPETCPPVPMTAEERRGLGSRVMSALISPITLIVAVLGSIISGVATPTESASVGAVGALFLAAVKLFADAHFGAEGDPRRDQRLLWFWIGFLAAIGVVAWVFGGAGLLSFMLMVLGLALLAMLTSRKLCRAYIETVFRSSVTTMSITSMVFIILLGATAFALVFTQMGGGAMVRDFLEGMPGGQTGALITVFIIYLRGVAARTITTPRSTAARSRSSGSRSSR